MRFRECFCPHIAVVAAFPSCRDRDAGRGIEAFGTSERDSLTTAPQHIHTGQQDVPQKPRVILLLQDVSEDESRVTHRLGAGE